MKLVIPVVFVLGGLVGVAIDKEPLARGEPPKLLRRVEPPHGPSPGEVVFPCLEAPDAIQPATASVREERRERGPIRHTSVAELCREEVADWLASGDALDLFSQRQDDLAQLAVAVAIRRDDPERALELVEALGELADYAHFALGESFLRTGDRERAIGCFVEAYLLHEDDDAMLRLLEIAPDRLEPLLSGFESSEARALLLHRLGFERDALGMLRELALGRERLLPRSEALLVHTDAGLVERKFRNLGCSGTWTDWQGIWSIRFAVDPDALGRTLEAKLRSAPGEFQDWNYLGDCRARVGDRAGALEAWWRTDVESLSMRRAYELAPVETLARVRKRLHLDEAHGLESLGDFHWSVGRAYDAQLAWRSARALDPSDWDIFHKLNAAESGLDPFFDASSDGIEALVDSMF